MFHCKKKKNQKTSRKVKPCKALHTKYYIV